MNKTTYLLLAAFFLLMLSPFVSATDLTQEQPDYGGGVTNGPESYSLGAVFQITCNDCAPTDHLYIRNITTKSGAGGYTNISIFEADGTTLIVSNAYANPALFDYDLGAVSDINETYIKIVWWISSSTATQAYRIGATMPQTLNRSTYISRCYSTGANAHDCPNNDTSRIDMIDYFYLDRVPAAGNPYAHVQVKDLYDNATQSGLTVYLGDDSNTTDGSGIAYFYNHTSGLNYTVDGGTNYFNKSGTATENATTEVHIYGAFPTFSVYDVEGTSVNNWNITGQYTSNTTAANSAALLLPPNATTDINVSKAGWYTLETNYTASSKDTSSNSLNGLYQSVVTINATNAYTGAALSNFTGHCNNTNTSYQYNFSTTGNTTTINTIFGNFTCYIDVFDYSISASNTKNVTFDNATETLTFALYSENSILVTIRNEEDNQIITDNVTVTVSGNASEDIYYTTTGSLFLENLTDGNYSLKFQATNFSLRTYEVTVADRSTQHLTAYLSPGTDTVTFAILDFDNSQALEGASVIMQRLINSTWTTVESKTSDITGRAQFTYTIGVKYRFTTSLATYDTKVFELDPIIFTSYVIRLEKDLILDSNQGLFDVTITWYPETFINEANNSFTITFASAGGTLESYGYTLTYPGGSQNGTGSNAVGGTFSNSSYLITGAGFTDRVNLTYWYKSVYGANKTYSVLYQIDAAANTGTLYEFNNQDYGLGTVEKIIIAVLCTVLFAGVLTLFGAPILGLVGGLLCLGFFTIIGFVSVWVTIPSVVVGFLLLARRSSE